MKRQTFKLSHIDPNPYRRMDRYPIRPEKVEALKESITSTEWWSNVVARLDPQDSTRAQIAYGHHRLQALRELYPPSHKIDLNIGELSDEQMIKIMARENMDEWGNSAAAQHETVRTIVEAYAAGHIEFHPVSAANPEDNKVLFREYAERWLDQREKAQDLTPATIRVYRSVLQTHIEPVHDTPLGEVLRDRNIQATLLEILEQEGTGVKIRQQVAAIFSGVYRMAIPDFKAIKNASSYGGKARIAPSFIVEEVDENTDLRKAYTVGDIAQFTGWLQKDGLPQHKVSHALDVLEVIERGILTEEDFEGLSSWQAGEIAQKARREIQHRSKLANLEPRPEVKQKILQQGQEDVSDMAKHIIEDITSKKRGTMHINESAVASGKLTPKPPKMPPHIDSFAERLATGLNGLLVPSDGKSQKLDLFITFQDSAAERSRRELAGVLRQLAARANEYADQLKVEESAIEVASPTSWSAEVIPAIEGETE